MEKNFMGFSHKTSINQWAEDDRPREKLISKGASTLSNAELLAILLGSGNTNESAVELGRRIMDKANNNLNVLGKMTLSELKQFNGVGNAKAVTILAHAELGRRRQSDSLPTRKSINNSQLAYELMNAYFSDLPHEEFWILLLNRSLRLIEKVKISHGGIAGTVVDIKIILKKAIEQQASAIILCHNHPSGNLQPSQEDIIITQKLKEAAKWMDIYINDHLIYTETSYFSMADEGIL